MNAPVRLEELRLALKGAVPAAIATCAADGSPNVTYVSQMQYLDAEHVALTFQFFNKTRENILANPQATALVREPLTGAAYRLTLLYLRTETGGPLFQAMKAKLAGIASHTGMSGVFKLLGADVYRVHEVERVASTAPPRPPRARDPLHALRTLAPQLAACQDLGELFDRTLALLARHFGITHAMLLMVEPQARRLYTVASRGYSVTGVGSEVAFGEGVIGVAAEQGVPIRINHMTLEYSYGRASVPSDGGPALQPAIRFPGLERPGSQLAVPVFGAGRLLGVLCAESPRDFAFDHEDEDALVTLASLLGSATCAVQLGSESTASAESAAAVPAPQAGPEVVEVRHYTANHSVFVGSDYLIKGVAGAILWKLLRTHAETGQRCFSNRELRAMPDIGLPELGDNLEARLVLLQRRLAERCPHIRLNKVGRGQLELVLTGKLRLTEIQG